MLWHIELKFCIRLCFIVLQIKCKCGDFSSIDQTLHQFANLLPNWTLLPFLTLLPNFGGFHRTLQRVRLANRGRLLLRTPGPVPFGTCICSFVETILSWTCHVYGPYEFRTSLGTSILLCMGVMLLLELRILEIHSFQHFFHTYFDILSWNFEYDFVLLFTFECHQFASIFVGVMPVLGLTILEIHSFPHFSPTCFDILSWNFSYDFL